MVKNLAKQYLTGQLIVSYRMINHFRVANAEDGSEENLVTLDELGLNYLIKYGLFDKEQKKSYQQSSKNLDNWAYG